MNAKISLAILTHIENGKTVREAFDAVLGVGAYEKMAGEVYDMMRNK